MSKTNIISLNIALWKHFIQKKKEVRIAKHSTRTFYKALDLAIEKCRVHPRKYYIVKVNASEWEILGSQEIRKMRKFSEARKDNDFRMLHETAPYIYPENIDRYIHERHRRKWHVKWWNLMIGNYYVPVTKSEIGMLQDIGNYLKNDPGFMNQMMVSNLADFIKKHE